MNNNRLCWLDLEMTGLNPDLDVILEIAVAVTDFDNAIIMKPISTVIHYDQSAFPELDPWVRKQHTQSGLFKDVAASQRTLSDVEREYVEILQRYCSPDKTFLAGNTIYQDRLFLRKYMPKLNALFHYRLVDVSSVKELVKNWYPKDPYNFFEKNKNHRALQDVVESMAELTYYRKYFFIQGTP